MKFAKKSLSLLIAILVITSTVIFSGVISVSAATDSVYSLAAQQLDKDYAYDGDNLGANYTPQSTTFRVWAPTATAVSVNLYTTGSDSEQGAALISTTPMTKETKLNVDNDSVFNGCWVVTMEGDYKNVYYTYSVTSVPLGDTTSQTKETNDVYSKATGVNGDRSMVVDLDSTDPEGWNEDTHVLTQKQTDATIWEIQVKDFSYSSSSGVSKANRGKYLAFTEEGTTVNGDGDVSTCIDYLKELGVSYVQINPFYDFGSIDETGSDQQFNWGYDPENYNVPEGSFSSNPYDGNVRIKECKQMIQALHNAGIGVVMDVVYNHTYSTKSCFQYTVPNYYYRLNANGSFSASSGCGNDTASERAMYRKFMIDSVKYWANEYHIDGFRFDLMGIHDVETMNLVRDALDEVDPRIISYGEGWSSSSAFDSVTCTGATTMSCSQGYSKYLNQRVGYFNDQYRDCAKGAYSASTDKGFVQGAKGKSGGVALGVRANTYGGVQWRAATPEQCVNYMSCHDNNTLWDKLCNSVYGANNGPNYYRNRNNKLVALNKFAASMTYSCQGMAFTLAGEEMARSKDGDDNSYKSLATENMIDWNNAATYDDLVSYYKGMIELRKNFTPFTSNDTSFADKYTFTTFLQNPSSYIAYTINNDTKGEWDKMAVIYNSASTPTTVTLADTDIDEKTQWVVLVNEESAGVKCLEERAGKTFTVPASSTLIMVDKASYDRENIAPTTSTVKVNHVLKETGEELSHRIIKGSIGSKYSTSPDATLSTEYEVAEVVGNKTGVYTDEEQTVTYYYKKYVPATLTSNDPNGDGKVSIKDGTVIQKYLADIEGTYDINAMDYNLDESVDIKDVSLLQRYLVNIEIQSVSNITIKYVYKDEATGKETTVAPSKTVTDRIGSTYKATPEEVDGYVCNDTKEVVFSFENKEYTFYYDSNMVTYNLTFIHSGDQPWAPTLWAWYENSKGSNVNLFGSWPGKILSAVDGKYSIQLQIPDTCSLSIVLSNDGANQTIDYNHMMDDSKDYLITIDDDKFAKGSDDYLTFSTSNPATEETTASTSPSSNPDPIYTSPTVTDPTYA